MLPGSRVPRRREPITKSASPRATGPTTSGRNDGTSLPSPSMKQTISGVRADRGDTGRACAAVAALRLADDARARGLRARRGRIGRAVVDHDHLVDACGEQLGDDAGDRLFFVETGNDDRDDGLRAGKLHQACAPAGCAARLRNAKVATSAIRNGTVASVFQARSFAGSTIGR